VRVIDPVQNVEAVDLRPIRPTSSNSPWERAIATRNDIAQAVRETLAREKIAALVYQSEIGNYPPWVRLEAWLPDARSGAARQRSELEIVTDVRPYRRHSVVGTVRLQRGKQKLTLSERCGLTKSDIAEWTRYAVDRGPKPASYRPVVDALLSILGMLVPPLHPRRNPVAREFRRGFWRPSLAFIGLYLLITIVQPAAPRNPAAALVLAGLVLVFLALLIVTPIRALRRRRVIAVTPEPTSGPRNLGLVDSWSSSVAALGSDYQAARRRLLERVAEARSLGADCRLEVYSYRTPAGYEERERLVVAKDQGQVHVHIYRFAQDVFVGWQGFLNWAGWSESKPISTKFRGGLETQFVELRPGFYLPQQFDLMDLNSLSSFVHSRIEEELKAILREKAIDQEIDFEVVRSDRAHALDRSRHAPGAATDASGIWARIFKSAAVWQPTALSQLRKSVAEPVAGSQLEGSPRAGSWLGLPLLALTAYLAVYMSGVWVLGQSQIAPRVYYAPVPQLTFAAVLGLGLIWRKVRPPAALVAAAVLFALTSLISIGQSAVTRQIFETVPPIDRTTVLTFAQLAFNVLVSVAIMLVTGAVASSLRKRSYWLIALILWPAVSYLAFSAVPILMENLRLDRSAVPNIYFAAAMLKQLVVFACIGYWLSRAGEQGT